MPPKTDEYTDETLEAAPGAATTFLCALGAVPEIFTILCASGMTADDIEEGQKLLMDALSVPRPTNTPKDTEEAKAQRNAQAALDNWDEPHFRKIKATLVRHCPSAGLYAFDNLTASKGPASVAGVATLLARLDALETGSDPARASTKDSDKNAVALLTKRGYDAAERKRLAALVKVALSSASPLPEPPPNDAAVARRAKLLSLKLWLNEWTAVAHADVKKKAYRIRLGIATRRSPSQGNADPEPVDNG
jgi:hypothetical protein